MNASPALIGLGSTLHSDEGIGPAVLARVRERGMAPPGWELLDLGVAGMGLLHALAGRPSVVLVDCAYMECFPGVMRVFDSEQARSVKALAGFSLHEGDLLNVIALSRTLGECPPRLKICGIEPADTGPGLRLSRLLEARLDDCAAAVAHLMGEGRGPC